MNKGHWALLLAGAGVLAWWLYPQPPAQQAGGETATASASAAALWQPAAASAVPATDFVTGLEALPGSLRDIEVDGRLRVDADGNLILDGDVRRLFEFFLNAVGEESAEQIVARIRAYIQSNLPAQAAAQAQQVLDEYLSLRSAMDEAQQAAEEEWSVFSASEYRLSADTLRERKQAIRDIRSRHLSPEVDHAFYADDDLFDDHTLAKLAVIEDNSLSPLQQSQRIAALEAQLPAQMQDNIAAATRHQTLTHLENAWQAEQGDLATLRLIRENVVGAEAADRLEQVDQRRATWNNRVSEWLNERDQILNNPALSNLDQQMEVERLRQQHFDDRELKRLQSLEHLHDQSILPAP